MGGGLGCAHTKIPHTHTVSACSVRVQGCNVLSDADWRVQSRWCARFTSSGTRGSVTCGSASRSRATSPLTRRSELYPNCHLYPVKTGFPFSSSHLRTPFNPSPLLNRGRSREQSARAPARGLARQLPAWCVRRPCTQGQVHRPATLPSDLAHWP